MTGGEIPAYGAQEAVDRMPVIWGRSLRLAHLEIAQSCATIVTKAAERITRARSVEMPLQASAELS